MSEAAERKMRFLFALRSKGVTDARVLGAMEEIDRGEFVRGIFAERAYEDMPLPIACGQTISQPSIVGIMTQALDVQPRDKVLEVGTGSGFMAALLAHQAASVLSLESDAGLAAQAQKNLYKAAVNNVKVRNADGSQGAAAEGPFDAILLSGSVAEVPQVLLDQLAVGGRLAAIVGDEPMMRATVITRTGPSSFVTAQPWDANAPRLIGFAEPSAFRF